MIGLICPGCGRKLKIKDQYAGKRGVCPHCKQRLIVPTSNTLDAFATIPPVPNEPGRPIVPAATASDAAVVSPTSDLDGEVLDFLAPSQGPGELGRLGTYRVLKVLGAGGMGLVLQAEDPQLQRAVALKVMRSELAKSKEAHQRFLREARAIAAIEHPHIVHVYQVGEDRGVPFLAMPFLKGESLESRLKSEGKLPVAEVIRLGRQIAEGLAAAHKNELIHRDIKPANIWLEAHDGPRETRDWVKILDFGLARAAGDDVHLTKTGTILGTPAYMAPEQARSEKVDARCDLFSLGAVLYRMLTGTLPFKGKDTMSQLMSLAADTPQPVRELNPDVPPSLADLVTQLLAKVCAERPPSARAVADALAVINEVSASSVSGGALAWDEVADALAVIEEGSGRALDFAKPKRRLTADQRAILEGPTRLIDPASTPPIVQGGTKRPRRLVRPFAVGERVSDWRFHRIDWPERLRMVRSAAIGALLSLGGLLGLGGLLVLGALLFSEGVEPAQVLLSLGLLLIPLVIILIFVRRPVGKPAGSDESTKTTPKHEV